MDEGKAHLMHMKAFSKKIAWNTISYWFRYTILLRHHFNIISSNKKNNPNAFKNFRCATWEPEHKHVRPLHGSQVEMHLQLRVWEEISY